MKMDFLPLGDVRTDPIINPTCLSDHVHTFYGASEMRPETTYQTLRSASGNSGNVVENKSLYWHPTVYEHSPATGRYQKDDIFYGSTYYLWTTGEATAFPDGFKMVAGFNGDPKARASAECVGPSDCERDDCSVYDTSFFPQEACAELEVSMAFPTCWDGQSLDSPDHMSHVSYDLEGGQFDGDCPSSHPVKIPEIQFFFRIAPYSGGQHIFSDGTSFYHADYFSGWKQNELQNVLDQCENDSDAAMPDAWCEDFVTFRDAPKIFDDNSEDSDIVQKLRSLQPNPPIDTSTITDELVDNVTNLPRGACSGVLKPEPDPSPPTATPPSPAPPTPNTPPTSVTCKDDCTFKFTLINFPRERKCSWLTKNRKKMKARKLNYCGRTSIKNGCPATCDDTCANDPNFEFTTKSGKERKCDWLTKNKKEQARRLKNNCDGSVNVSCSSSCGRCSA